LLIDFSKLCLWDSKSFFFLLHLLKHPEASKLGGAVVRGYFLGKILVLIGATFSPGLPIYFAKIEKNSPVYFIFI